MSQNPNAIVDSNPGVCPKCGSRDIEYKDIDLCQGTLTQECCCNECGCRWAEYFNYTFDHKEISE